VLHIFSAKYTIGREILDFIFDKISAQYLSNGIFPAETISL